MQILNFTKTLLKISVILNAFGESYIGAIMEIIKKILFTLPLIYAAITAFAFAVSHIDNLSRVAASMYVSIGSAIAIALNISFLLKTKSVKHLLQNIEALVNESE